MKNFITKLKLFRKKGLNINNNIYKITEIKYSFIDRRFIFIAKSIVGVFKYTKLDDMGFDSVTGYCGSLSDIVKYINECNM